MKSILVRVSVIVPTLNSWHTLKDCINSIKKQKTKVYEIIVINNGSIDNTAELVKKYFPRVKLVNLKKNTGVTGGRNEGIKKINKESNYVLFFDHDMIADKNMVEEMIKVVNFYPDVGIVTPKIYYLSDKKRIWAAGTSINLWTGQVIFRGGQDKNQYNKVEEVQVAPAALLVKREVINKIGGFDNKYFATYEDTDFCFRARKFGFKTYYCPKAVAFHNIPIESSGEAERVLSRSYWIGRNRVFFMKDFGKSFLFFLFFIPIFGVYYFIVALRNQNISAWIRFIRGTAEGLFIKR